MLKPTQYAPNPNIPYVSFKIIGDTEDLTYPANHRPQHLLSLAAEFLCDEAGWWNLSLFDETGHEVEERLKDKYSQGVHIKFGWYDGLVTQELTGYIMDWTPEFTVGGVILHINGAFFDWATLAAVQETRAWPDVEIHPDTDWKSMKISDIVYTIIVQAGFEEGEIVDTSETLCDTHFDFDTTTNEDSKTFVQVGSGYEFIRKLAPYATTAKEFDGKHLGGYVFYIDPETRKAYFKPMVRPSDTVKETFYYFNETKGMSEIISFNPDVHTGVWVAGGMVRASAMDIRLKEKFDINCNQKDTPALNLGSKRMDMPQPTMKHANESIGNATLLSLSNAENSKIADSYLNGMWGALYNYSFYNAKMRVVGRVDLKPLDSVKVVIQPPKAKKLHYASGRFVILGVKHSISAAGFFTEYDMIKNAALENAELPAKGPTPSDDDPLGDPNFGANTPADPLGDVNFGVGGLG